MFDESENIFPQVREHHEIMYDGRWLFCRGILEWTMKFHKPEVAEGIFLNIEEAKAAQGKWIKAEFKPLERGCQGGG